MSDEEMFITQNSFVSAEIAECDVISGDDGDVEEVNSEKSVKEESDWHEELATTIKKSDKNKAIPHNITINFIL